MDKTIHWFYFLLSILFFTRNFMRAKQKGNMLDRMFSVLFMYFAVFFAGEIYRDSAEFWFFILKFSIYIFLLHTLTYLIQKRNMEAKRKERNDG